VPTLYATVTDLQAVLQGTDQGSGCPAELTSQQLTLALQAASNRVSVYFGTIMDGSNPQAQPPDIFHDLTLDLASFYAWRTYLKGKTIPIDHAAYIAYKDAMATLQDARNGKIRLDPAAAGGVEQETGTVINRIPPIFTGNDSNTRIDPLTGDLESDVPFGHWAPRGDDSLRGGGPVYQG
jgi:hypothetical protein